MPTKGPVPTTGSVDHANPGPLPLAIVNQEPVTLRFQRVAESVSGVPHAYTGRRTNLSLESVGGQRGLPGSREEAARHDEGIILQFCRLLFCVEDFEYHLSSVECSGAQRNLWSPHIFVVNQAYTS